MSETFATDELRRANNNDFAAYSRPCSATERHIRLCDFLRLGETALERECRITLAIVTEGTKGILAWLR